MVKPTVQHGRKDKDWRMVHQPAQQALTTGSKLRKVFNPNTVKLSYSCTPNIATIIKCHINLVRNTPQDNDPAANLCNCRGGVNVCPLKGECLMKGIVYKVKIVEGAGNDIMYIGSTSTTFEER